MSRGYYWTAQRKAALLATLATKQHVDLTETLAAHGMAMDEYQSWVKKYGETGLTGLMVKNEPMRRKE